jgi:polyphosphate kinase
VPYLHDQRDAWLLDSSGRYKRVAESGISAQQALMQRYS